MVEVKRVVLAIGTRPEAIKLGPVYAALQRFGGIDPVVLSTGQHREQLAHGLSLFSIVPSEDLHVMEDRQDLPGTATRILSKGQRALTALAPDYLLVQGDTLTTFCLAWLSFVLDIPVGHVEAGLRTNVPREPFPEEMNRRLTDGLADLLLAATDEARENLLGEGHPPASIVVTGQTGIDAALLAARTSVPPPGLPRGSLVTVTLHRRENWPRLKSIAEVLRDAAERWPRFTFVFPVHLNPVVRDAVWDVLSSSANVMLLDPLDYGPMAALLARSDLIITDSGGLQEEGSAFHVPTLVVRNVTERPEGVATGHLRMAGNDPKLIRKKVNESLDDLEAWKKICEAPNPFGDGKAAERVASCVGWRLGLAPRPSYWTRYQELQGSPSAEA